MVFRVLSSNCSFCASCFGERVAVFVVLLLLVTLKSSVLSDECEVFVGGTVTNVIPTYKPNGLRKNNEWKSVQELKLSTYIRREEHWNDVGTEQVATIGHVNKGQTRRRQRGEWRQEGPFS